MHRWIGRTVLVTGASSGIGESITRELVSQGLTVVGIARRLDKLQALHSELAESNGNFIFRQCDVSKEEEIVSTFKWMEDVHGGVDVIINNAGINRSTRVIDGDIDTWKSIFDVNVFGLSVCTREAIKSMNKRNVEDGHVININSLVGHMLTNMLSHCIYSISKHVVTLLSEHLRRELVEANSQIKVTGILKSSKQHLIVDYSLVSDGNSSKIFPLGLLNLFRTGYTIGGNYNSFSGFLVIHASLSLHNESISPGRVMTPIFQTSNCSNCLSHCPLIEPKAIADAVVYALSTPPDVQVTELTIRPVGDTLHRSPPEQI